MVKLAWGRNAYSFPFRTAYQISPLFFSMTPFTATVSPDFTLPLTVEDFDGFS